MITRGGIFDSTTIEEFRLITLTFHVLHSNRLVILSTVIFSIIVAAHPVLVHVSDDITIVVAHLLANDLSAFSVEKRVANGSPSVFINFESSASVGTGRATAIDDSDGSLIGDLGLVVVDHNTFYDDILRVVTSNG